MKSQTNDLRVAYVSLDPPKYSETFVTSEVDAVRRAGVTVEQFSANPAKAGRLHKGIRTAMAMLRHPVSVLRGWRTLGFDYGVRGLLAAAQAESLVPAVRRYHPDVIHSHFVNLPTAVAVLLGRRLGTPVTAMAHAADFLLERRIEALDRRIGLLSHLFVISSAALAQLRGLGVQVDRRSNSVVRAATVGELPERRPAREDAPIRLVSIARLVPKKGIDTVIDAVGLLNRAGFECRYDVFGGGPLHESLHEQARSQGLLDHVRLHGEMPHKEAVDGLAGAHVAVLACRADTNGDLDGIPVFLMEAARMGVPVVSTDVTGIPELVVPGAGWLVPPSRPDLLASAIQEAAGRAELARERARALHDRVGSEFSPDLQATRLKAVWLGLLERRPLQVRERTAG